MLLRGTCELKAAFDERHDDWVPITCLALLGTVPGGFAVGIVSDCLKSCHITQAITPANVVGLLGWGLAIPCFFRAAKVQSDSVWACLP